MFPSDETAAMRQMESSFEAKIQMERNKQNLSWKDTAQRNISVNAQEDLRVRIAVNDSAS